MDEPENKPGLPFWFKAVLSLPVLYVLSFWPAIWIMRLMAEAGWIGEPGEVLFMVFYYPICRMLGYPGEPSIGYCRILSVIVGIATIGGLIAVLFDLCRPPQEPPATHS